MKITTKFRSLLNEDKAVLAPGAFDGLTARMVEQAGFSAVYASGGAMARAAGFPDIGLLSLSEVVERLSIMTSVVNIPVIADADTGFGNEINTQRTIRLFERAGVAAYHIEDQEFPKRCGHLDGKSLISRNEMVLKIKAAKDAQTDSDLLCIARTDAIAVEGFDAALERATAYVEAGADMIFVEAPTSLEQIEKIAEAVPGPKLMNMFYGGKTPLVPIEKLNELAYKLVIIPSDLQRAAIFGVHQALSAIREFGDSSSISDRLASFNDREEIIGTADYFALAKRLE